MLPLADQMAGANGLKFFVDTQWLPCFMLNKSHTKKFQTFLKFLFSSHGQRRAYQPVLHNLV